MKLLKFILIIIGLLWGTGHTLAQDSMATAQPAPVVSLVTFYPGEDPFSIYGHTEVRVQLGSHDYYYNYGVYDFESPGFVMRFIKGDAPYYCVAIPAKYATAGMEGRRMVEQVLNLTPQQARKVSDALIDNIQPGNNTYQYQYLSDNCSTMPRRIVEQAIDDGSLAYHAQDSTITYRQLMQRYGSNYAWQQFGIDLVLGSELDKPLDVEQQMFVPIELMQGFAGATINGAPLVSETRVMVDGDEKGLVLPPTPWWCSPMAMALLVLVVAALLTWRDVRRKKASRWFDFVLFLALGLVGCVIAYLVLFSSHEAVWPNYNILWANPLHLFTAIALCFGRRTSRLCRVCLMVIAVLTAAALLLCWCIPQQFNAAFFPLMIVSLIRSLTYAFGANGSRQR